ncbi:MAG: porphobilinogen synthase [Bacillota bacterium]
MYPVTRGRRLRASPALRNLVRETKLHVEDLIYPLFVTAGKGVRQEIPSMPGVARLSVDLLGNEVLEAANRGVGAVILFGVPDRKDEAGSMAFQPGGVVQEAVSVLKKAFPSFLVITDVCLCQYSSSGHCGLVRGSRVLNDESLEVLAETALSHAKAGADLVAPSDMMDGRVGAIRKRLDAEGFVDVGIMAYSAKYASAFYGPFREVAASDPSFGDRLTYQMDPANAREAVKEAFMDIHEGADIVMVKPALPYLDIMAKVKAASDRPVATYNVSGEYSMVKAAAANGWLDERRVVMEILTSMKRAGADMVITYHAKDAAGWLKEG